MSGRAAGCRHEKAVGRLREETRALRLLTQQAVEERAQLAAQALVRPGSIARLIAPCCLEPACAWPRCAWRVAQATMKECPSW